MTGLRALFPRSIWREDGGTFDVIILAILTFCLRSAGALGVLTELSVIGKPAAQSTTHYVYVAGKALDGVLSSFTHTVDGDPHTWWRVDLETEHCLGRITVANRQDCCGDRFAAAVARAGLSSNYADNQPCGLPATRAQSTTGATVVFLCDPPRMARYVTLDIDPNNPNASSDIRMQLAEVNVAKYAKCECLDDNAAKKKTSSFIRHQKSGMIGNADPVSTKKAQSLLRCVGFCNQNGDCFSFDFAQGNNQCRLFDLNSTDIEMIPNDDFSIYTMILK